MEGHDYPDQTMLAELTITHAHSTSSRIRSSTAANLVIFPFMIVVSL
jgi:hypothetical protein